MNVRILAYFVVALVGCATTNNEKPKNMDKPERKTYLALGDSYTIGTSIAFQDNFPNQLADSVKARTGYELDVKVVAQNGWRTDDLQRGIKRTDLAEEYDLVSLLIGVNNQYQGLPIDDFEKDFRQLIDTAIRLAGGEKSRVFVLSIPNYGYTPFGAEKKDEITSDLEKFNSLSMAICDELNIDFQNITDISLLAESKASYRASDELHPSKEQYAAWVNSFLDSILEKLN